MKIINVLLLALIPFLSGAQTVQVNNEVRMDNIRTVRMYKAGFEMSPPVMNLKGGNEQLILSFDDLDGDLKNYRYTIQPCDAGWIPSSGLTEADYITGYRDDAIREYGYSYNTLQRYTHYTLRFPTPDLRPSVSGNFLLRVFLDLPGNPVIVRRFKVLEPSPAGITGEAHRAGSIDGKFTRQQVDFTIHLNGMRIADPRRELKVIVTQNDRLDNAMYGLQPRFIRGDELDFQYGGEKTFNGGNEFRSFDIKSLVYQTERVGRIWFDSGYTQVSLLDDVPRTFKNYSTEKDLNGRHLIKNEENTKNSDTEADYAWIYFSLPYLVQPAHGEIYLLGGLTDWQLDDNSRMIYNYSRKGYEKRLFLKQGYYDYLYVFRDSTTGLAETALIEGDHWETENEYTVWVYYREAGGLFDRLIAIQDFNTIR